MHVPVMLAESIEFLAVRPDGIYCDATTGLGSHTAAIARRLTSGWVLANDRDAESLELARANTAEWAGRIRFRQGTFSTLPQAFQDFGISKVDGLLADLGVSRYQLTGPERGFSFMTDSPLDMRMSRDDPETAADIVNFSSEKDLANLIFRLGEEGGSRRIARQLVRARPITSTRHLAKVIESVVPRTGPIHPATRTFMALRMAVNRELEELDDLLETAPRLIAPGGRMVVISFHSLEDRKVKVCFQELVRSGRAIALTKKVVKPTQQETNENAPSRSAKLRAVEMK